MNDFSEKGTEYEFTLSDGSKRYEICMSNADVFRFQKMHRAISAKPVEVSIQQENGAA